VKVAVPTPALDVGARIQPPEEPLDILHKRFVATSGRLGRRSRCRRVYLGAGGEDLEFSKPSVRAL
jgi:hypothetical protein